MITIIKVCLTHFLAGAAGGVLVVICFWIFFGFSTNDKLERRNELLKAEVASTQMRRYNIRSINSYLKGDDSLGGIYDVRSDSFLLKFLYHYNRWDSLYKKGRNKNQE